MIKGQSKLKTQWDNAKTIYLWEWILFSILFVLLFISYNYWDLIITTRHSINFWTYLFKGDVLNFYQLNVNPPITNFNTSFAAYPFTMYLIFAIWDFPLWILEFVFKIDPFTSRIALLYAKSILIPFLIGSCIVLYKIAKQLKVENYQAKWCVFLYLSSIFVLSAIGLSGQYDIFSVLFSLLGLYYYLKQDNKKFILFFAIAISAKLFAVFLFVPLLLLRKKKIYQIFLYGIAGFSLYFLLTLLFRPFPQEYSQMTTRMISFLFKNNISVMSDGFLSLFVFSTLGLWIYCYIKDETNIDNWMVVYIALLSYAILFLFAYTHPYWIILIAPYISLVMVNNIEFFKVNILLETVCSAALLLHYILYQWWCYTTEFCNYSVLSKLFGIIRNPYYVNYSLRDIVHRILKDDKLFAIILQSCTTVFVVGMVSFLIFNFGLIKDKGNVKSFSDELKLEGNTQIRTMVWIRFAINLFIVSIPILIYLFIRITGRV